MIDRRKQFHLSGAIRGLAAGVILGVLAVVGTGASSVARPLATAQTHQAHRCAVTGSPYGPVGVYIFAGHVSCSRAAFEIRRAFRAPGISLDLAGGATLFSDGWICGGQMGYYICQTPTPVNPAVAVDGRACRQPGCPEHIDDATLPTGPHPTPPVAIPECVPSSYVAAGSLPSLEAFALLRSRGFKVRAAGRARRDDLNYESLRHTCSPAMVAQTWYTDLHPPGMPCHACDSHEYWVRLRSGTWAVLGSFSG